MRVRLTNGHEHEADLVISAIGVRPNLGWLPAELRRDPKDGGILVNRCAACLPTTACLQGKQAAAAPARGCSILRGSPLSPSPA